MPGKLTWHNPVLQETRDLIIGRIVPEDQWLMKTELGDVVIVAQ
jgi:hypothetical protein